MNNWIWNTFDAVSSMLLSSPAGFEEEGTTEHNDDAGGCISGSFLKKSDTLETAPSSDSFKTPSKPARAGDVRELFDKAELSPPKEALGDTPQEAVKQFVDGIFRNENNESKWNTMSPNEQAKCSFLFHLVQECKLPVSLTREQLTQALDLGCPCGKRLESVTKRGGDSSFHAIPPGFPHQKQKPRAALSSNGKPLSFFNKEKKYTQQSTPGGNITLLSLKCKGINASPSLGISLLASAS